MENRHANDTDNRLNAFPKIKKHPFKILAFDWDGTAVENRLVDARPVAEALEDLLRNGVYVVVITGTNFGNIDRQFSSLIKGPHKRNLYVCSDRGSEVRGFNDKSEPVSLFARKATPEEDRLLNRIAEAVERNVETGAEVGIEIVYQRLNRRKIDLIPEWPDPPKSRIGELYEATEDRLKSHGFSRGIKGVYDLARRYAEELGLADTRITSDVKHVEVGLTDKSDAIRWVLDELARKKNIPFSDILILGDEFGPVAGFEGSDFLMYRPDAPGLSYVSVGKEPHGVPEGVIHAAGGPSCFLLLVKEQGEIYRKLAPSEDPTFLLVEEGYDPLREREIESLFTVGNGYLGTRGSLEERTSESDPATLVAGVFDRQRADEMEELAVVPDWLPARVYVDGEELRLDQGKVLKHRRILDMTKGVLWREWKHRDKKGRITSLKFIRFASLAQPHAVASKISIVPENYRGEIRVSLGLESRSTDKLATRPVETRILDGTGVLVVTKTRFTDITVAQAQASRGPGVVEQANGAYVNDCSVSEDWKWQADAGQITEIEKFVSLYTSRDGADPAGDACASLADCAQAGFNELFLEHIDEWQRRWQTAAVSIQGDPEAQLWVNFAAYHLITAGNPRDERVSISARALTGTVYRGHVFWDADMFMLPFFVFTHPPTARAMLMYRYHTLPGARKEAQELGLRGALFAWESTTTGEEMAPEFVVAPTGEVIPILTGKLEQHINSAVAYGVWLYWIAAHDLDFLLSAGAELLVETARFWASRVEKENDTYHINYVTGPDEYHEIADDNVYTNMMAAWNMQRAGDIVNYLQELHPENWQALKGKLGFDEREQSEWREIAANIYVSGGFNNLIEQFVGFFALKDIDVSAYEPRSIPLDIILGRRETAETQVVKQADVVQLLYLLEDQFSREVIEENFSYYERRTGHGSSLSPAIHGLVAARLGLTDMAVRYLNQAGTIDLSNNLGNAAGGVHAAALGGLWQQIMMGFVGVRPREAGIFLCPRFPEHWRQVSFSLLWGKSRLDFEIASKKRIRLAVGGESEVNVGIYGQSLQALRPGKTYQADWDGLTWKGFLQEEPDASNG